MIFEKLKHIKNYFKLELTIKLNQRREKIFVKIHILIYRQKNAREKFIKD